MKQNLNRTLTRLRTTFMSFTVGQRMVAVIGTAALLLAAFMVFRWVSTPNYAPLYSSLASEDASAVIDELNAEGIPYQLSDGGSTIMVPKDSVYSARISLAGQGLPANSSKSGYDILDGQDISTSDFQEQTDFKRAMEGELATTIEAIDGVNTAIVHLALPEKKVFADEQDPPTASILISTAAGADVDPEKVQAIINLTASSIDGLDPDNVTVTDSTGRVLSSDDGSAGSSTRDQAVASYEADQSAEIQAMLDRVVGAGNSIATYTADLDFDKVTSESTTYDTKKNAPALSESTSTETYNGNGTGTGGDTGVVGPDGQMDTSGTGTTGTTGSGSDYTKESRTSDNGVSTTVEHRETAPGALKSQHISVVLDQAKVQGIDPVTIKDQIAAAMGIDPKRDTIEVTTLPFDRTADDAAAKELAAADAAKAKAAQMTMIRNGAIGVGIALMLLLAWLRARKSRKQREERTQYLVEQIRQESADRAAAVAAVEPAPALAALETAEQQANEELRRELEAITDRQPDEIATLLRGWLVERH
jgi:flagellar M-ring protein FliF